MDSIIKLSRDARKNAQHTCVVQNFWNGLGVGFVVGDLIALIALFYHADSLQLALLFGALFASFPAAMFAPKFLAGVDCTSIWRWMWLCRTALLPLYFFVPLLAPQYQAWAVVVIYFCFCALRSIGVSASVPVLQVITSSAERPAFMGKNIRSFTMAFSLVVLAAYLILEVGVFDTDLHNYQLMIGLGIFFSIIATGYLFRLPHTGALQPAGIRDMLRVAGEAFGHWQCRRVILLTMVNTVVVILCSYTIPYMKELMQLSSGNVVLMSLIGLVAAVIATQMLQIIGRRISSWGLILTAHLLVGVGVLFFACAGSIASASYMFLFAPAVVLIYFGRQAGNAILLKVQTDAIPPRDRYAFSALFQLSGVVSAVLTIVYIKICESWLQDLPVFDGNKYIPIFLSCVLFCAISSVIVLACHGLFKTAADLKMLAPRSLFTFIQVHMLSFRHGRISRLHGFEELMSRNNSLSVSLVMEFLQSRNIHLRNSAMRSLLMQQIDQSRPLLLAEAMDKDSPNREIAVSALGLQKPMEEYIPKLRELLKDPSGPVRSSTVKTLLRYGYELDADEFASLYAGFTDSMQKLNALIGVSNTRRVDLVRKVFEQDAQASDKWLTIVFQTFADTFGKRSEMVDLIDAAMADEENGKAILAELFDISVDPSQTQLEKWLPVHSFMARCCSAYLSHLIKACPPDSSEHSGESE